METQQEVQPVQPKAKRKRRADDSVTERALLTQMTRLAAPTMRIPRISSSQAATAAAAAAPISTTASLPTIPEAAGGSEAQHPTEQMDTTQPGALVKQRDKQKFRGGILTKGDIKFTETSVPQIDEFDRMHQSPFQLSLHNISQTYKNFNVVVNLMGAVDPGDADGEATQEFFNVLDDLCRTGDPEFEGSRLFCYGPLSDQVPEIIRNCQTFRQAVADRRIFCILGTRRLQDVYSRDITDAKIPGVKHWWTEQWLERKPAGCGVTAFVWEFPKVDVRILALDALKAAGSRFGDRVAEAAGRRWSEDVVPLLAGKLPFNIESGFFVQSWDTHATTVERTNPFHFSEFLDSRLSLNEHCHPSKHKPRAAVPIPFYNDWRPKGVSQGRGCASDVPIKASQAFAQLGAEFRHAEWARTTYNVADRRAGDLRMLSKSATPDVESWAKLVFGYNHPLLKDLQSASEIVIKATRSRDPLMYAIHTSTESTRRAFTEIKERLKIFPAAGLDIDGDRLPPHILSAVKKASEQGGTVKGQQLAAQWSVENMGMVPDSVQHGLSERNYAAYVAIALPGIVHVFPAYAMVKPNSCNELLDEVVDLLCDDGRKKWGEGTPYMLFVIGGSGDNSLMLESFGQKLTPYAVEVTRLFAGFQMQAARGDLSAMKDLYNPDKWEQFGVAAADTTLLGSAVSPFKQRSTTKDKVAQVATQFIREVREIGDTEELPDNLFPTLFNIDLPGNKTPCRSLAPDHPVGRAVHQAVANDAQSALIHGLIGVCMGPTVRGSRTSIFHSSAVIRIVHVLNRGDFAEITFRPENAKGPLMMEINRAALMGQDLAKNMVLAYLMTACNMYADIKNNMMVSLLRNTGQSVRDPTSEVVWADRIQAQIRAERADFVRTVCLGLSAVVAEGCEELSVSWVADNINYYADRYMHAAFISHAPVSRPMPMGTALSRIAPEYYSHIQEFQGVVRSMSPACAPLPDFDCQIGPETVGSTPDKTVFLTVFAQWEGLTPYMPTWFGMQPSAASRVGLSLFKFRNHYVENPMDHFDAVGDFDYHTFDGGAEPEDEPQFATFSQIDLGRWKATLSDPSKLLVRYRDEYVQFIRNRVAYSELVLRERSLKLLEATDKVIDERIGYLMFGVDIGLPPIDMLDGAGVFPDQLHPDYRQYEYGVPSNLSLSPSWNFFYPKNRGKSRSGEKSEGTLACLGGWAKGCEDKRRLFQPCERYVGVRYNEMRTMAQQEINIFVANVNKRLTSRREERIALLRSRVIVEERSGLLRRVEDRMITVGEGEEQRSLSESSIQDFSGLLAERARTARREGAKLTMDADTALALAQLVGRAGGPGGQSTAVVPAGVGTTSVELVAEARRIVERYGAPPSAPGVDMMVRPEDFILDMEETPQQLLQQAMETLQSTEAVGEMPFARLFALRLLTHPERPLVAKPFVHFLLKLTNHVSAFLECRQHDLKPKATFVEASANTDLCLEHGRSALTLARPEDVKAPLSQAERIDSMMDNYVRGSEWSAAIELAEVPSARVKAEILSSLPPAVTDSFKRVDYSNAGHEMRPEKPQYRPSREEQAVKAAPPPSVREERTEEEDRQLRCVVCFQRFCDTFVPEAGPGAEEPSLRRIADVHPQLLDDDPVLLDQSKLALEGYAVQFGYTRDLRLTYIEGSKGDGETRYELPEGHADVMEHCTIWDHYREYEDYREDKPHTWPPIIGNYSFHEAMRLRQPFERAYYWTLRRCPQHGLKEHWSRSGAKMCEAFSEQLVANKGQRLDESAMKALTEEQPLRRVHNFSGKRREFEDDGGVPAYNICEPEAAGYQDDGWGSFRQPQRRTTPMAHSTPKATGFRGGWSSDAEAATGGAPSFTGGPENFSFQIPVPTTQPEPSIWAVPPAALSVQSSTQEESATESMDTGGRGLLCCEREAGVRFIETLYDSGWKTNLDRCNNDDERQRLAQEYFKLQEVNQQMWIETEVRKIEATGSGAPPPLVQHQFVEPTRRAVEADGRSRSRAYGSGDHSSRATSSEERAGSRSGSGSRGSSRTRTSGGRCGICRSHNHVTAQCRRNQPILDFSSTGVPFQPQDFGTSFTISLLGQVLEAKR
jgi:hypothetical protein